MPADLIDRYLAAVRRDLPDSVESKDDVIAELADSLQSSIDEKSLQLGRDLAESEIIEVLRHLGHPRTVAASYGTRHALIGAEILPFYIAVLRTVLSVAISLELFVFTTIAVVTRNADYLWSGMNAAVTSLFTITGVVTVLFALLERRPQDRKALERFRRWDPRTLPASEANGLPEVPRVASVVEFLINACVLLALLGSKSAQVLVLFWIPWRAIFAQLHIAFSTAWSPLWLCGVVSSAVVAVVCLVNLVRPDWARVRESVRVITNALLVAGCGLALSGGALIVATDAASAKIAAGIDMAVRWSIGVGILLLLFAIASGARRLLRKNRVAASTTVFV